MVKNKMKHLFSPWKPWRHVALFVALACGSVSLSAQTYQLFVWMKSGLKTGYLSTDEPRLSPAGDYIRVSTRNLSIDIPRDDIDRFTTYAVQATDPTAITLPAELELTTRRKGTTRVEYRLTPENAVTTVTWFNSAPEVVRVDADGTLTPLAPGEAILTAQTTNGLQATCHVSVRESHLKFFVWETSGQCLGYELDEEPQVMNRHANLILLTDNTVLTYPRDNLLRFTLEDVAFGDPYTLVGIEDVPAREAASPAFRPGDLTFSQLRAGERVRLYDAAGRLAAEAVASVSGTLRLTTRTLPAGIYVIKTEHSTFKIQKQ